MVVKHNTGSVLAHLILLSFLTINEASLIITPVIGVPCDDINVCVANNSYCISGTCVCDASSFVPDAYNVRCLTTVLGDACTNDADCSMTSEASNCRDNQCLACNDSTIADYSNCKDPYGCAYHEYEHKCWKYREVGEKCEYNEQCWIYPHSNTTRVCDKFCVCALDYVFISGSEYGVDMCKLQVSFESTGHSFTSSTCWIVLLLLATGTTTHLLTAVTTS